MQSEMTSQIQGRTTDIDFLTRLNIMLATHNNYPECVTTALGMIGSYTQHDRVQVIEVRPDMSVAVLHEWHSKELAYVDYEAGSQQFFRNKKLEAQLYAQDFVTIDGNDESIDRELREQLGRQEAKKMILFPLIEAGAQFAFIAYIQCAREHDWSEEEKGLMAKMASVVAIGLHKRFLVGKLQHHLIQLKKNEQKVMALQARLKTLNEGIQPAWQDLKGSLKNSAMGNELPQTEVFDRHICTLNRICRNMAVK